MKLLLIAGARPNFMKIAPVIHAIANHNATRVNGSPVIEYQLVHTGQHYDARMSDVFFDELGIPAPDVTLEVGSGSHAVQTARIMERFEPVCAGYQPDWVVVVGDVNSTVACALVATKLGVKVAHVEGGLRSRDRDMPEEINRLVTDSISDLLLPPSQDGVDNLLAEGVPARKIALVGNIMIDSLVANLDQARESRILDALGVTPGHFAYLTLHRPSNVDDRGSLAAIVRILNALSERMALVFPIHPRTRKMLKEFELVLHEGPQLQLIDPIGYHDSLCLTENARLVLTDSGGLQEETTYFRTPCLTLRPNTERPITITQGSNKLTTVADLEADLKEVLAGPARRGRCPELWDGRTAERVLEALVARTTVGCGGLLRSDTPSPMSGSVPVVVRA